ncbi:MAG: alpha/beta family hydrolase [Candidatus Nanopelagicales bacterium]
MIEVATSKGPARFLEYSSSKARATLVLGHGAGGGGTAPDLLALAEALPASGVTVLLHEQPWKVAGKKVATAPPTLDIGWVESLGRIPVAGRLIVGGRSAGARVACRTAGEVGASAVLALAFPLHPPGKPEKSRADELAVEVPLRIVQGERDPFGRPEEFPSGVDVVAVPGDHTLRKGLDEVVAAALAFVDAVR